MPSKRRALISVFDKTGVEEFARELQNLNFEIVSTGGTLKKLREAGLKVTAAESLTGFPEMLGGRVKTLHPVIHGGLLARQDDAAHLKELEEQNIKPFSLVAVNLYPFEEVTQKEGATLFEVIENIDIGGPAMIRAAAKNHDFITVVVSPQSYNLVLSELKEKGEICKTLRRSLAAEAFSHTANYDAVIYSYFKTRDDFKTALYPERLTLPMVKMQDLRYGENPQQEAAFYRAPGRATGLASAKQLQGKALSFNNLNDLNAAWDLVLEFEKPAAVAVKHTNPCGVGAALSLAEAYSLAYASDPVAIFGGVVALNRPVDEETATKMVEIFLEVIAAPGFSPKALEVLKAKEDIRLLEMPDTNFKQNALDIKKVRGGFLLQTFDTIEVDVSLGQVVTKRTPTLMEWRDLNFAQKVARHVRSNAIVVAKNEQTLGVGAGQMSRIGAAKIALKQAGAKAKGAVLGSDAFFPFPDTVEEAFKAGITAIVQPGGSLKDKDSILKCDEYNMALVLTGKRYFKH